MKLLAPITADDFERIASVLGPCELVKGEIIPMAPAGIPHSDANARIGAFFFFFCMKTRNGRVLIGEAGLVVQEDPDTVRGADALYISHKRLPRGTRWHGFLRQPPELVVEVMGSDATWDKLEEKVSEYHAFGVDEVWVIDPNTFSVRVYPKNAKSRLLHESDTLTGGKLLPGFKCKVADLFVD